MIERFTTLSKWTFICILLIKLTLYSGHIFNLKSNYYLQIWKIISNIVSAFSSFANILNGFWNLSIYPGLLITLLFILYAVFWVNFSIVYLFNFYTIVKSYCPLTVITQLLPVFPMLYNRSLGLSYTQ